MASWFSLMATLSITTQWGTNVSSTNEACDIFFLSPPPRPRPTGQITSQLGTTTIQVYNKPAFNIFFFSWFIREKPSGLFFWVYSTFRSAALSYLFCLLLYMHLILSPSYTSHTSIDSFSIYSFRCVCHCHPHTSVRHTPSFDLSPKTNKLIYIFFFCPDIDR